MKKTLLSLFTILAFGSTKAQTLYSYGFDTTNNFVTDGWITQNSSGSATATIWALATYDGTDDTAPFGGLTNLGQAGGQNSFALVNYTSTTGAHTINNWLISPVVNVQNGDVVTFYTRIGLDVADGDPASFADRLQLRMSTTGAASTTPAAGPNQVGTFTTLLADVNPDLTLTDYPTSWDNGLITVTISGLSGPTDVKFGFRYYVTNGGPTGANSDIIGIDSFEVNRPTAGTRDFFASNFSIAPNPVKDIFNLASKNSATINNVTVVDINGRIVSQMNVSDLNNVQVNIADLKAGVYFVKAKSELGIGTSKIIKE